MNTLLWVVQILGLFCRAELPRAGITRSISLHPAAGTELPTHLLNWSWATERHAGYLREMLQE